MDSATLFTETPLVRKKKRSQKIAYSVFATMTTLMVIPLLGVVGFLIYEAWPVLSIDFVMDAPERGMRAGGIWPAFWGTMCLVFFSVIIAAPVGVLAAVYLNEYAPKNWFTRVVNLAVFNLAGVPSIVQALFGLGAFVLGVEVFGVSTGLGKCVLAASLTLAIMTMPVIIESTKESLAAVPTSFREACWNVGATKWQTIRGVVLPNSLSGILTGIILEVCRAAGETAPIMFTGAVFYKAVTGGDIFAYGPMDQCMALSMHLHTISTQVPGVDEAIPFATAVVLLGTVICVNATAIALRVFIRTRKKW